jgi:hypothetical protein
MGGPGSGRKPGGGKGIRKLEVAKGTYGGKRMLGTTAGRFGVSRLSGKKAEAGDKAHAIRHQMQVAIAGKHKMSNTINASPPMGFAKADQSLRRESRHKVLKARKDNRK